MPDLIQNLRCVVLNGEFSVAFSVVGTPLQYTDVLDQKFTVPASAQSTPFIIDEVSLENNSADQIVAIAVETYAPVSLTFRTSGGVSLGSKTFESGYVWVQGSSGAGWFTFGGGDIDTVEVTRLDDKPASIELSLLIASKVEAGVLPAPPNTLLTNLIAYYDFSFITGGEIDEVHTFDYSHRLVATGTVTPTPGVRESTGMDLTGAGNYLTHATDWMGDPYLARAMLSNPDTSYSFWVRLDGDGTFFEHTQNWSDWGGLTGPGHIRIEHTGSGYIASIEWINAAKDGSQIWTAALPTLPATADGAWYHVAITRDSSDTVRFYINNVLDATIPITSFMQNDYQGKGLYLGRNCSVVFDEFGVWSRQLSDAADSDIEDLYNAGSAILLSEYQ